ncbi:LysR family transcriptional regulator [Austwickia chelonae]|uniref:LysR family transcriptional regulator n=1 Tax=Austwickia chelonae TaxID=100225 RepID=UPI000E233EFD|nr:LysR family transcriptional regulator [Austwickia chelonae]
MLDPVKLRTLVDIAALGSIAAAAKESGITASAASQHITALEERLGTPLLERLPRSTRLTAAGAALARAALPILDGLDDAIRLVDDIAGTRAGRIRLGTFASAANSLVLPAVSAFLEEHQGASVDITEVEPGDIVGAVLHGGVDLAVTHRYAFAPDYPTAGLSRSELFRDPLLLAVPGAHRLAGAVQCTVADTVGEAWVAPRPREGFQAVLTHLGRRARFTPDIRHRADSYELARELVASGLGVSLIPQLAAVPTPGVVYLELTDEDLCRQVDLIQRRSDSNPSLPDLVAAIIRRAQGGAASETAG